MIKKKYIYKWDIDGVLEENIDAVLKDNGKTKKEFIDWMYGQTVGMVEEKGNQALYYLRDVERFIEGRNSIIF